MNLFIDRHQELLKDLLDANVDFIIIGGYSVIFHGYKRTTGDVDIWLKPDNTNKVKLLPVLKKVGFDKETLEKIAEYDFTKHLVISIWEEPEKVDFLTRINLVSYEDADKQKVVADIDGIQIPFIHVNHLVLSKITTGRAKDKADIEELQRISALKKNK